ncbi:MAG: hypothetical protein RML94_08795 [Bacteroidia bacterium]|nr:hypothetical protein [Bacteroidia bacterium]
MPTRSACYGLTVLHPTRPPPRYGVKGVGLRTKPDGLPSACLTQEHCASILNYLYYV